MKQSGVTLITLVITVVIMAILAGAGIEIGMESIHNARVTQFNTELRLIHARVNELKEEFSTEQLNTLGKNIPTGKLSAVATALETSDTSGYRYFNATDIKQQLGLDGIDREVVINFTTKDIADINGVQLDDETIYKLEEWVNEEFNANYLNENVGLPTFSLDKKIYGLNATIFVNNIEYNGAEGEGKGTINYCRLNDNGSDGIWKTSSSSEIPVSVSGTYKVKITNAAGKESTNNTIEIVLTNKPKLDSGMTPVVYVEGPNNTEGYWKVVSENSGDWYDYSSDKAKWANVMLQDGLEVDNTGRVTSMGSMFVWIPRYMYQIPAENYHTNNAGTINIKFLKGTTNLPTDESNVTIANVSGGDNWNVHPAFCDGNKTNYANGEWDKDLTGIWFAKFEASSSNTTSENGGGNNANLDVKILPSVQTWKKLTPNNIYTVCEKMTKNENIYNLSNNAYVHLIKNSEWGMTVYLTQSKYGKDGRVWNNPTTETGYSGNTAEKVYTSGQEIFAYNTANGINASTTGNIYGIYDMSGGTWEKVAAFSNLQTDNQDITNLFNAERKYTEFYLTSEQNTPGANYEANSTRYGDAIYETSGGNGCGENNSNKSWLGNFSTLFGTDAGDNYKRNFMARGGRHVNANQGIYAFFSTGVHYTDAAYGFRVACIVE